MRAQGTHHTHPAFPRTVPLTSRAMKSRFVPAIVAAIALAPAAGAQGPSPFVDPDGGTFCGCGKSHALRLRAAAGLPIAEPASFGSREAFTDTDVLSNDVDFEINIANTTISGSNTIRVRSLVNGLTQFTFMLRSQYSATITLNGSTPATASTPASGSYARTVTLDRPYNAGEEFTVRIAYSGTAVSRGFGSIEFQTQNGTPIVTTLSEAYFAATWMPVKDGDFGQPGDNADKATWKIAVTAPDTLNTVSNGLLQGVDTLSGGRKRYRWQTDYPMSTYLAHFSTTNYTNWEQSYTYPLAGGGTGTMPVRFSIYPASDTPANRAAWELVLPMLATFRPVFGEYPFVNERYGIYQFPFGGGMEHQTSTGQGTFSESVTAHELGHQWWGDNVTCKTWNHIWLNEGFATYSEALWYEGKPGSSGLPALHAAMASRRPSAVNDSVYVYATTDMNRIFSSTYSYRKGAWVLHMLRRAVGDAAFFQILADYRAAFEGSGATTEDFAAVVADVTGSNFDRYFDQWVYQIGAPDYQYGWQAASINGKPYLRLRIEQVQNTTWGVGSCFQMPVDLLIDRAVGAPFETTVNNTARIQHFLVPLPGSAAAAGVTLDPSVWILNLGKVAEAYVPGPPKVVEALPAPGHVIAAFDPTTQVELWFSDNVTAPAAAFSVTGPEGAVPFSFGYSGAQQKATLTFGTPLPPGEYTVGILPTVTANGLALDGEITSPAATQTLPSGDGLAGGALSYRFTVMPTVPPCPADRDGDSDVDSDDLIIFFAAFESGEADFDSDGDTDSDDVIIFFTHWDSGC